MPRVKLAQNKPVGVKRRIPDDAPLFAGEGPARVRVVPSATAHALLQETGVTFSHTTYRLKRACDRGDVRYAQVDSVRRLYALDDLRELADILRAEHDEQTQG